MKRSLTSLLVFCLMLVTSCNQVDVTNDSHGTLNTQGGPPRNTGTIATSSSTVDTSYSIEYDIDQTFLNVTFEDVYNLCEELTGVDLDDLVESEPDHVMRRVTTECYDVLYIPDFSAYLDMMTEPDDLGYVNYDVQEYEYHIKRRLIINDFLFDEFEDDYWADVNYSMILDTAFDNDSIMDESEYLNGFAFMRDESYSFCEVFYANYISDCCLMNYYYSSNQNSTDNYEVYLELCDYLGLPTSSEMTDAILA